MRNYQAVLTGTKHSVCTHKRGRECFYHQKIYTSEDSKKQFFLTYADGRLKRQYFKNQLVIRCAKAGGICDWKSAYG